MEKKGKHILWAATSSRQIYETSRLAYTVFMNYQRRLRDVVFSGVHEWIRAIAISASPLPAIRHRGPGKKSRGQVPPG